MKIPKIAARRLNGWHQACVACLLCVWGAVASPAQSFKTLLNFNGENGAEPMFMSLVQGADGDLYGTTSRGGAFLNGTVFKLSSSGQFTTIYSFCSLTPCIDGAGPYGGLVLGRDGDFYGTTLSGGTNGRGTVFKVTKSGILTTLHNFDLTGGAYPWGPLIQATDGNFYGIAGAGGSNNGFGTVFKVNPAGSLTTLHTFAIFDGSVPNGGLVQAADGTLYGTTVGGGAALSGTVFKITLAGALSTIHSFCADVTCSDGGYPSGGLVLGSDGNFYGTASEGGVQAMGTMFKITPQGALTTIHSFAGYPTEGATPEVGLIQGSDGNFYGTTTQGGSSTSCPDFVNGCGTVFKFELNGALTTLHSFNLTDGAKPYAGLAQATSGTLYGTTTFDGAGNDGTVFSLSLGLNEFVETVPVVGAVGASVKILGTNLTGTTVVTFNGVPATFTVKSPTLINATIPTGATTGRVEVTTPSGTLTSNTIFRVR